MMNKALSVFSRRITQLFAFAIIFVLLLSCVPATISAYSPSENYAPVVVSLGDSYSSGEGIEPFFGQDEDILDRLKNDDWIAHRSENAWSGMLRFDNLYGPISDHRDENWFFVAASGAKTEDMEGRQRVEFDRDGSSGWYKLSPQLKVFEKLEKLGKQADYVTISIGGNDADFGGIVTKVVMEGWFDTNALKDKLQHVWTEFYKKDGIRHNIKETYKKIEQAAGKQATIIVAGYPKLFNPDGYGVIVSEAEADLVNKSVHNFNIEIEKIVNECRSDGMNIHFVSVEDAFEGHAAYSDDPYINSVMGKQDQDLKAFDLFGGEVASSYSMHPNYDGACIYADCVQELIDSLEEQRAKGVGIYPDSSSYTPCEREVVLVLDTSGSMDGNPIDQTKKAAIKFVNTVFQESAGVGVVEYNTDAGVVYPFSDNASELEEAINELDANGSTNIEDGLTVADNMLSDSRARKKIIVLMSDGEANQGKVGDELIAYADELKAKGYYIYTLGFFGSLSSRSEPQRVMEKIASDGCHYEVDNADSLVYFFGDIADQINGQNYIYVRIACPVDVSVTYNGETLNSSGTASSARTSFGSLTFEDEDEEESSDSDYDEYSSDIDNRVKILRLKEGVDYDIKINGTGSGHMNYSIGFMDENDEYTDIRRFKNIEITPTTKIDSVAKVSDTTVLNVDEDGDGIRDKIYEAGKNGEGKIVDAQPNDYSLVGIIILIIAAAAVILIVTIVIVLVKRAKKKQKNYYN